MVVCSLKQFRPSMQTLFRDHYAHTVSLSAAGQKPLLDLICKQLLESLPPWMRLFTTSRDEPLICRSLNRFQPIELRADEEKNRKDVDMYLRKIAGLLIANIDFYTDMHPPANTTSKLVRARMPLSVTGKYVRGELSMADIELDAEGVFPNLNLKGKLTKLKEPIRKSKAVYSNMVAELEKDPAYSR